MLFYKKCHKILLTTNDTTPTTVRATNSAIKLSFVLNTGSVWRDDFGAVNLGSVRSDLGWFFIILPPQQFAQKPYTRMPE
jgi:hypothetical protein